MAKTKQDKSAQIATEKKTSAQKLSKKGLGEGDKKLLDEIRKKLYSKIPAPARIALIVVAVLLLLTVTVFAFRLDSLIFETSVQGNVYSLSKPVSGLKLCIGKKCTDTNEEGYYRFDKIFYGRNTLLVRSTEFQELEFRTNLKRGENTYDLTLLPKGLAIVKGKMTLEEELTLEGVVVDIDGSLGDVNEDGSFEVMSTLGQKKLRISTPYYKDIEQDVDLKEGEQGVEDIVMEPRGDVVITVRDWLSEADLKEVTTDYTGSYNFTESGQLIIEDLEIGGDVAVNLSKKGYLNKKFEYNDVVQGENPAEALLVREGKTVYISSRTGNREIYSSNIDGSGENNLSKNSSDDTNPEVSSDGKTVYFLSNRDKSKKNEYGYVTYLLYSAPIGGGSVTKISKTGYEDNGGSIGYYDIDAKVRLFSLHNDPYYSKYTVRWSNIDGTGTAILASTSCYIGNLLVAKNASFMFYQDHDGAFDYPSCGGIVYMDTKTKSTRAIYNEIESENASVLQISKDNKKVYVSIGESGGTASDIWEINIADDKKKRITNTAAREDEFTSSPDGKKLSYISTRDNKSDVYVINSDGSGEKKVTTNGKTSSYFWAGNYIFYYMENALWVIDPESPKEGKKVTDNAYLMEWYGD